MRVVGIGILAWAGLVGMVRAEVDFVHEVMPVLRNHCAECHTGNQKKGGLAMNTRAQLLEGSEFDEVVSPGKAGESLMMKLIRSSDEDEWMPPKGPRLTADEVGILEKWINEGMPWPEEVTLGQSSWEPPLKPRVVELPPVHQERSHPVDRILDAGLLGRKAAIPEPADDRVFLRRATLDAVGLLPTPDELEAFVSDQDPDKRNKVIDRLLANEVGYADHWLTMWNDLLRNDYTGTGFITGGRKQITSWLYQSLRDNKPYDQFVKELISPGVESEGFINGIKWRGDVNSSQTREIQFSQNISQVFLGINMKCASCHDSFIDRWKLEEAYSLAAIFADKPLELHRCDKPTGTMAKAKWIFPELGDVDAKAPRKERLEQLAGLMTHRENGRFTRTLVNRYWERLMGRGIVHPVDAMDTKPWNEDLLDALAVQFADDGYDLKKLIRFIMTSKAYQSKSVVLTKEPGDDYQYAGPLAKRMTAEQLLDTIWQVTGTAPGKTETKVDRRERIQNDGEADLLEPRAVSAKWIWHQGATGKKSQLRKSFTLKGAPGRAILMATCDNAFVMKINGVEVAASREWTSPVYVEVTNALREGDNLIEVDAEMFGGSAGFIAEFVMKKGDLQRSLVSDQTWQARPPGGQWKAAAELKPHGSKPWGPVLDAARINGASMGQAPPARAALVKNDFLMRSLGRPHRDQVVTSRPNDLTTLQAIDLANGDLLAGYLSRGAQSLGQGGRKGDALINWVFLHSLSRLPSNQETAVLLDAGGQESDDRQLEDLLWLIFMQPEFQIVR
ncbi:MAG: DUF1549 domain-containing protein [Akkermansiaceae bacterium]